MTIKWYKGRDEETKDRVAKLVTDAICEGCGCPPEAVSLVFQDVDKREWYRAGVSASKR
ncbi:MAG: 4-oxalocrotonate tautomerase family protein [Candidatus Bathyarchaeota archaeon]|nr:4-oxalocrotonate tautomerase family protein [Candidatus Bathyarchaeota archaeon]